MAHFDSPKNRAIWDREIASLRPERAARAATGFMPAQKREAAMEAPPENALWETISFQQLETIVHQERQQSAPQKQSAMAHAAHEKSAAVKAEPVKVAPVKAAPSR